MQPNNYANTVVKNPFFPNRFYSIEDLRIDQYFLNAAKAFREWRWPHCICLLETWRDKCPKESLWSWRGVNVYIRLLATKTINAVLSGRRQVGRTEIWFTSMKSLAEVLSDDNRALVQAIREVNTESISALAEATGRKAGNLSRTLKTMSRYGIVEMRRGEESRPAHCEGDGVSDHCRVINSLRETVYLRVVEGSCVDVRDLRDKVPHARGAGESPASGRDRCSARATGGEKRPARLPSTI